MIANIENPFKKQEEAMFSCNTENKTPVVSQEPQPVVLESKSVQAEAQTTVENPCNPEGSIEWFLEADRLSFKVSKNYHCAPDEKCNVSNLKSFIENASLAIPREGIPIHMDILVVLNHAFEGREASVNSATMKAAGKLFANLSDSGIRVGAICNRIKRAINFTGKDVKEAYENMVKNERLIL